MKNETETSTIDRSTVIAALRDIGEPTSVRDLGTSLGFEDLRELSIVLKDMAIDRELKFKFNSDDVREYWVNDEVETEATPESVPTDEPLRSEKILAAIDARRCTLTQIKSYIGVHRSVDISLEMEELEHNHVIERDYNGEVTAFFRQGQIPAKWWITGDGTIGVEEIEVDENAPHPFADRIGKQEVPPRNAIDLQSPTMQSRLKDIAASDVENAFAQAGTVEASAAILKISRSTLEAKLSAQQILKDAAKRGRAMFYDLNPNQRPAKPIASEIETIMGKVEEKAPEPRGTGHKLEYSVDDVRRLAAELGKTQLVAEALGYSGEVAGTTLRTAMKRRPELRIAYDAGIAEYKAANPVPETPIRSPKIKLSPEQVEEAAAEHGNQRRTAAALGFNVSNGTSTFRQRLESNPELAEAFERGITRFKELRGSVEKAVAQRADGTTAILNLTPEMVEAAAAEHRTKRDIAIALGYKEGAGSKGLSERMKNNPELQAAYDRGRASFFAAGTETPAEPSTELPTPETHATESAAAEAPTSLRSDAIEDRDEIKSEDTPRKQEESANKFPCQRCGFSYSTYAQAIKCFDQHSTHRNIVMGQAISERGKSIPSLSSASIQKTHLTFKNGSQLLVAFEGNILDLDPRDRDVLIHFAKCVEQYENGQMTVTGHDDRPRRLGQRIKDAVMALID